jgi:hypothetical protein
MQNTRSQSGTDLTKKWDKWVINRIQSETNITFHFHFIGKDTSAKRRNRGGRERERERAERRIEREEREMRKGLFRFLVFVWNIIPLASAAVFFNPLHASFPDLPAKPGNSSSLFLVLLLLGCRENARNLGKN